MMLLSFLISSTVGGLTRLLNDYAKDEEFCKYIKAEGKEVSCTTDYIKEHCPILCADYAKDEEYLFCKYIKAEGKEVSCRKDYIKEHCPICDVTPECTTQPKKDIGDCRAFFFTLVLRYQQESMHAICLRRL